MNYPSKKDQLIQALQPPQTNFTIFASYSTKDIEKIRPVLDRISRIQGVRIFFAEKDLQPGDMIDKTITQHILSSDIFLLFFSESAKQSNYVQQEIGVALGHTKIIIPLLLDGTKPTGMLANVQYLDLSDETKRPSELERLYNFIMRNVQTKNQNQLIGALAVLGIGYLLYASSQNQNEYDDDN
jgi:hypothetical protein